MLSFHTRLLGEGKGSFRVSPRRASRTSLIVPIISRAKVLNNLDYNAFWDAIYLARGSKGKSTDLFFGNNFGPTDICGGISRTEKGASSNKISMFEDSPKRKCALKGFDKITF